MFFIASEGHDTDYVITDSTNQNDEDKLDEKEKHHEEKSFESCTVEAGLFGHFGQLISESVIKGGREAQIKLHLQQGIT